MLMFAKRLCYPAAFGSGFCKPRRAGQPLAGTRGQCDVMHSSVVSRGWTTRLADGLELALGGLRVVQRPHAVQGRAVLADQAHQHARVGRPDARVAAEAGAQPQGVDRLRAAVVLGSLGTRTAESLPRWRRAQQAQPD